jgi:signal transduction histidine kinase
MTGRIMLVTALGVLLVQGINTAMRYRAFQARAVVEAASHLATTVANQIERIDASADQFAFRKRKVVIVVSEQPIQPAGFESTDALAERVAEPLKSIYPQVASVRLSLGSADQLPLSLAQNSLDPSPQNRLWRHSGAESKHVLLLVLHMDDGRWVHALLRVREPRFQPLFMIGVETLLIYMGVLVPLLLVIRQISKPLRQLNRRLAHEGLASGAPPLEPQGPDDIRSLIDSFNAAERRVNNMLTEKDVMLGAIGHDLKTPLAALRVRIESVEDEGERDKMAACVDEMVHILDDILVLARLGKSSEAAVLTDITALVAMVAAELDNTGRLVLIGGEAKCRATVRPVLLRRALRNLIGNALQYGKRAHVSTRCDGDWVTITIEDDGPGLSAEQLQSMFEPFARVETSRNRSTGGAGLGLTIARAIARAHRGDVTLQNREGGGLCAMLTVRL